MLFDAWSVKTYPKKPINFQHITTTFNGGQYSSLSVKTHQFYLKRISHHSGPNFIFLMYLYICVLNVNVVYVVCLSVFLSHTHTHSHTHCTYWWLQATHDKSKNAHTHIKLVSLVTLNEMQPIRFAHPVTGHSG